MGDFSSMLASGADAVGSGISTAATDVGQFAGNVGGDLAGGWNALTSGIGGLFGGSTPAAAASADPIAAAGQVTGSAAPLGAGGGMAGLSAGSAAGALPNAGSTLDSMMSGLGDPTAAPGGSAAVAAAPGPGDWLGASLSPSTAAPDVLAQSGLPSSGATVPGTAGTSLTPSSSSPLSGVTGTKPNWLTAGNLLRYGLPAAGLGYSILNSLHTPSEVKAMEGLQKQTEENKVPMQNLASTAINGQLPGPAQTQIDQAKQAALSAVRARYASMGMSGSSAEATDLANVEQASVAQQFQIGQQLAQTGLQAVSSASGLESQLLDGILQANTAQGTELGNALSAFAGAAARGG